MRRSIAIGISSGMTIGFGVVFVAMTFASRIYQNVVLDERYSLYLSLAVVSFVQWILIKKGTVTKEHTLPAKEK